MDNLPKDGFGLLLSEESRKRIWDSVLGHIEAYVQAVPNLKVPASTDQKEIQERLVDFTFVKPRNPEEVIHWVAEGLTRYQLHTASPAYYGVFNPNPATMGVVAETMAAAFNPQLASTASSLFCIEVENHLLKFFGKCFGYSKGECEGNFTVGATEANHTALLCALSKKLENFNSQGLSGTTQWPVIYTTFETHHSILRAARLCGLGTEAVVEVPTKAKPIFDPEVLRKQIQLDRASGRDPLLVVGTLGTTSAGMVDPLRELAEIAREHRLWFHVDAAWGGAAALLPEYEALVSGLELADSISFDPHKWLSLPMGIGMFLTKHLDVLRGTFDIEQSHYMPEKTYRETQRTEPYRQSLQWSRRFIGLKLFMALATHGLEGYQSILRHQIRMGDYLRKRLEEEGWEIVNETPLPVVCFVDRKKPEREYEKMTEWIAKSGKSWLTTTRLSPDKRLVLRAGISNFATREDSIDLLVDLLGKARSNVM